MHRIILPIGTFGRISRVQGPLWKDIMELAPLQLICCMEHTGLTVSQVCGHTRLENILYIIQINLIENEKYCLLDEISLR